ncbi:recombinase family protein [Staphylococcus hominis]
MSIKPVEMESKIKRVVLYLRLSRGEGVDDLSTHERRLTRKCDEHNWSYEMYKEIGSGSTIKDRPVMQQLLNDVERELFDAVVVVDLDRLSRGSGADNDRILYSLKSSNTLGCCRKPLSNSRR